VSRRFVVIARDGVALAEGIPSDSNALAEGDGLFEVDPDPRPLPMALPAGRLTVLDARGTVLGQVSWVPAIHGPTVECVAWNIGVMLLPHARGRGVGTLCQRLLVEYLFANTGQHRIEASTDVDNLVEQRALVKVGMHREGVARGAQRRDGQWRDIVLFSILRTDL
jgi:RimJ/RimL family protein N-acetyltransferase